VKPDLDAITGTMSAMKRQRRAAMLGATYSAPFHDGATRHLQATGRLHDRRSTRRGDVKENAANAR